MRQLRELFRLKTCEPEISTRSLALRLGVARSTVHDALGRFDAAGLTWPLADELTDEVLGKRLFSCRTFKLGKRQLPEPDWAKLVLELKRPGVSLTILWEEYRAQYPEGYGYSRFCELYRGFEQRLSPTMRQHHVAGEKCFVDYSGKKIDIMNAETGELRRAEIFVAVMGASSYTYAEITWTQSLPDWIGSHVRLFSHLGACPKLVIPDNLKSGVNKASFYDPELNQSYAMMAEHYGIGIMPTRPYHPRDKAKVEVGVRIAQSYILGRLRNHQFFSLEECNELIWQDVLLRINGKVTKSFGQSRAALYQNLDRPAMRPLPSLPYEYAEWKKARVNLDYHVEVLKHFYSVPNKFLRLEVDVRITVHMVDIFYHGEKISTHVRSDRCGFSTRKEHMPSQHAHYANWSESHFQAQGAAIGPHTAQYITELLASRKHPEQAFRSCIGILKMLDKMQPLHAEVISARAFKIRAFSSKSVRLLIENERQARRKPANDTSALNHPNIRGSEYYQ